MEYTRDEVFSVDYEKNINKFKNKNSLMKLMLEKMARHKIITVAFLSFFMFSCLNFFLIYKFMSLFYAM